MSANASFIKLENPKNNLILKKEKLVKIKLILVFNRIE